MDKIPVIYIAAPYGDPDPEVVEKRMKTVRYSLAKLISEGCIAFSPLLVHHILNEGINLPAHFTFWEKYCLSLLRKSDKLVVLTLPGWETSYGVNAEIKEAERLGIPCEFLQPYLKVVSSSPPEVKEESTEKTKNYTVYVADLNKQVTLPCPSSLPEPGTTLTVKKPFATKAGHLYERGDAFRLISRTHKAPYGYLSSLGNWIVECNHQVSVWSNIEAMMAEGVLE